MRLTHLYESLQRCMPAAKQAEKPKKVYHGPKGVKPRSCEISDEVVIHCRKMWEVERKSLYQIRLVYPELKASTVMNWIRYTTRGHLK